MSSNELIKVVVDRRTWYRGKLSGSRLLRKDGHMCCLGFAAKACGCVADQILEVANPCSVEKGDLSSIDRFIDPSCKNMNNRITQVMIRINDNTKIEDHDREHLLKLLGMEIGLDFEFIY